MVKKITSTHIIHLFLNNYNQTFYLRELAHKLKKPHQTVKPYVESLVRKNILRKIKRKNVLDYALNFNNKQIYDYLVIAEKEKLMDKLSEETLLKILFENISPYFDDCTFIIFGSATTKVQKGSDIDLLMIGKKNISKTIKDFEDVYNKRIHLIQTTNIKKLTSSLVKEVYEKHLIFNNTELIIRSWGKLYGQNKLV